MDAYIAFSLFSPRGQKVMSAVSSNATVESIAGDAVCVLGSPGCDQGDPWWMQSSGD